MPQTDELPVLIVGAGPTGLNLAIWLTRLGIKVRIVDRLAQAGTTSRALAVQARTLEFYRMLGFAADVVGGGVKVAQVNLWARGRRAAKLFLSDAGEALSAFPFPLVFPQDAHERLLVGKLAELGVAVERPVELMRFAASDTGVQAVLKHPDGREETCAAAYLAGCDGARSAVRQGSGIGFPGGTYEGLFYVADVTAEGPPVDRDLHVDLEEADLLIVFPLQGQGKVRLVGDVSDPKGKGDKELTFEDVSPRAIRNLGLKVEQVNWFSTYRVHHRVADRFRAGRALLLGDAAHIHSPAGGQGMNTGIGDAVNLAWKLAAVLRGTGGSWILDTYETERIAFARRLVATTDQGFRLATARGGFARWVRTRVVPAVMPVALRSGWMRRVVFRTVSQIEISYRQSALSVGRAGKLQAGDRLPWVKADAGRDNFESLRDLRWQVHAYAGKTPELDALCQKLQLPLHEFDFLPAAARAGFRAHTFYLVRPDGYIGWIGSGRDLASLTDYLTRLRSESASMR